jgi:hypothetical protein
MSSNVKIERDEAHKRLRIVATLEDGDMAGLRLDAFDQMVIDTPFKEPADIFQNLEIIFRRMKEQNIHPPSRRTE